MFILLGLALAGCGGGSGYNDATRIDLPTGIALAPDAPSAGQRRAIADDRRGPIIQDIASPPAVMPVLPAQDVPPEVAQDPGPRGTSGEVHEDSVGYSAAMTDEPEPRWSNVTVGVAYSGLPTGTLVELTALDTGRTIVALVVARETGGALVALSSGAAQALGVGGRAAVRVRSIVATPQDEMALRSGGATAARLDAPPALLTALRRKLPGQRSAARTIAPTRIVAPARMPAPTRPVVPPSGTRGGFIVQVAALSSAPRAAALARDLGGRVTASGPLYRVQLGPFADAASAMRARDGVARRGYGDARIVHTE